MVNKSSFSKQVVAKILLLGDFFRKMTVTIVKLG